MTRLPLARTSWARAVVCLLVQVLAIDAGSCLRAAEDHDALQEQVVALIAQLDSADYAARNEATRQLGEKGPVILPLLVEALGSESREVRFRVQGLLAQQFAFDDVVAPLVEAVARPYGGSVRTILRDRALRQVEEAGELQFAKRLFDFWGTDIEEFRRRVTFNLMDAKRPQEAGDIVEPLVGLKAKATQFQDLLARLEALSLSYDHRHSPGHVVAQMLAAGLRVNDPAKTQFAERYVTAFESLTRDLGGQGLPRSAVRKEVTDRANMSDGATDYLVQLLYQISPAQQLVAERMRVVPRELAQEFFRGLSAVDAKECYRCVGKVHIVDMLGTVLASWPDAPRDGDVQTVIANIEATIVPGDKPKALVLLDALEGFRDLSKQQLNCRDGVGQQLAHRLQLAAVASSNMREYHPVRFVHDRFLQLIALGITPDHAAFPRNFWEGYLRCEPAMVAEDQRSAISQYVGIVELLSQAGVAWDQPALQPFLARMQDSLVRHGSIVLDGSAEVRRLLQTRQPAAADGGDPVSLEQALNAWTQSQKDRP